MRHTGAEISNLTIPVLTTKNLQQFNMEGKAEFRDECHSFDACAYALCLAGLYVLRSTE